MVLLKMVDSEELVPERVVQRQLITQYIEQHMAVGQTWCLVDIDWYKKFKQYVGLEVSIGVAHPGPINNSPLFSDDHPGELKEHLMDQLDYVLLPEKAWKLLVKWYGVTSESTAIKRQVVEYGLFIKYCKVEIYPVQLRLCKDFDYNKELSYNFSIADPVRKIETVMRTLFKVPNNVKSRLWSCFSANAFDLLNKPNSSIQDEGLYQNQLIVIETAKEDGTWYRQPIPSSVTSAASTSSAASDKGYASECCSQAASSSSALSSRPMTSLLKHVTKPGLCGLSNLGNTCFMNSTIQCMSNCPPITNYFIHDGFLKELNVGNPLGMKGEIAKAFANLIKTMWSGQHTSTVPHQFKLQVGRFAPQFCGYQQHDAQELLTFLLDGLHEDLNRVKNKPYIQINNEKSGTDEEMAAEAWRNYRKRNDSIIVDFFHGMLKSTVICPDCNNTSITFDPFCYLSLPLPSKQDRHTNILFFPLKEELNPLKYTLELPNNGTVQDLIDCLANVRRANPRSFIATEVINHYFRKIFTNDETLGSIHDTANIYVYEVPLNYQLILPVYMCELNEKNLYEEHLFGYPLLISVNKDQCTNNMLYDIIRRRINFTSDSSQGTLSNHRKGNTSRYDEPDSNKSKSAFSLYFISKTASNLDVIKIHDDNKPIQFPEAIGNSHIAATWYPTDVKKFRFTVNEVTGKTKYSECRPLQLTDCLRLFTASEMLSANDTWYCPGCKKHQLATKKFDIWRLPKILIMHFKRFSYSALRKEKIDTMVRFPLKDLNMSEFVINKNHPKVGYDLIGVSNHYGRMGGGHYTAYCRNKTDKGWYLFDDSHISKATEDNVVSPSAYVLFYMQHGE